MPRVPDDMPRMNLMERHVPGKKNDKAQNTEDIFAKMAEGVGQTVAAVAGTLAPLATQLAPGLFGATALGGGALGLGGIGGGALGLGGGAGGEISQLDMIKLQRAVNMESLTYQTISNIEKTKHDAEMNAVRNMKA